GGIFMFFTHEIQTGETLENLAQRFDTTVEEIMNYNEIRNPTRISARTVIIIPVPIVPPTVPSPRPPANFSVRVIRGLLYVLSTDRMLYRRSQPVRMTLVKTNITDHPIALRYPTSQRFDFYVRRGTAGRVLWQWSADRVFAQVVERLVLQPGQSQVFRANWDQRTNEGEFVGTGVFTVQGENVADELMSQRVSLRIRIV
ncbi:MAG: LysM peptidoglycan-binding domain-containing protein, partial [Clostridia bacterium]|nr:LysM peptidoglycan-binding domain-containing protein [Clostridia bacterium]